MNDKDASPDTIPSGSYISNSALLITSLLLVPVVLYLVFGLDWSLDIQTMSTTKANKQRETQNITSFREITGASQNDATKFVKKYKSLETAVDAYFNDPQAQASASSKGDKAKEKKLGEIWEQFKDDSNPKLITIDGTMQYCEQLGIDPSSDPVLFCLATDLGSKVTGEWEKEPFVQGWAGMPGSVDSISAMKDTLPSLRTKLNTDPVYFKRVYMHTFDLVKAAGSRTLPIDTAVDLWTLYIPPALESRPSALARIPAGDPPNSPSTDRPPEFTKSHFDQWIEFQKKKGKAVSKDTWSLFVDFVRSIDADFKEYDDSGAWPSTIDDFVEYVTKQ